MSDSRAEGREAVQQLLAVANNIEKQATQKSQDVFMETMKRMAGDRLSTKTLEAIAQDIKDSMHPFNYEAFREAFEGAKLETKVELLVDIDNKAVESALNSVVKSIDALDALDLTNVEKRLDGIEKAMKKSNDLMGQLVKAVRSDKKVTYDANGRVASITIGN